MNKHKKLIQTIIKQALISGGIVAIFIGIFIFTSTVLDASVPQKTEMEGALQRDRGEISNLTTQLEKSGVAENRFITIQRERDNLDFSVNSEALKDWLRNAKDEYRLSSNFKLNMTTEKPLAGNESSPGNYEIFEHPGMKLEFSAISDAHVFSFLEDFLRSAPGFIRIDSFSIKRTADIDANTIDQLRIGATPYLVDAKIEFNWIGLKDKITKDAKDASGAPARQGAR